MITDRASAIKRTDSSDMGVLLRSCVFQERSLLQFRECLPQLFLCVHYDRAVSCDGLFERFSRD